MAEIGDVPDHRREDGLQASWEAERSDFGSWDQGPQGKLTLGFSLLHRAPWLDHTTSSPALCHGIPTGLGTGAHS